MLALLYLILSVYLGDVICRRFIDYSSMKHRIAAAVLVGFLFGSCITYLAAVAASSTGRSLLWANVFFFALVLAAACLLVARKGRGGRYVEALFGTVSYERSTGPQQSPGWDFLVFGLCLVFGTWLMFATLQTKDGGFAFAVKSWSDFGPHLSLAQSMALGNNYPTEHPFFPGEFVRYHFLFWFLSANLSFLGLNLVVAANLLSIASLLALLFLIATFAEDLFGSRAVGRLAAVLFFFPATSLSYIPFLLSRDSVSGAVSAIAGQKDFVKSGFNYRGDDWGSLTVAVFSNQRQLFCAIGIVLIVLIHLVKFYRSMNALENLSSAVTDPVDAADRPETTDAAPGETIANGRTWAALAFCGLLVGLLPYWNSAIFVAASLVLGSLFVLFPRRQYLLICIAAVVLVGLPQVLLLRSGNAASTAAAMFEWGYLVTDPTVLRVLEYIGWTFGLKLAVLAVAAAIVPAGYRKLLLALTAPAVVVFLLKLSTDIFNNHKLLNFWNVAVLVFVAFAIWHVGRKSATHAILAAAVTAAMIFGAVIDLFPVHNDSFVTVPHTNDRLTEWLLANTRPEDIFLSDTLISHPILFSGRRVFLGNTLFAWTSGYDVPSREAVHRRMLTTQDINELRQLLSQYHISYAAFDDGVRENQLLKGNNENLFRQNFELVFNDTENKYRNLKIYRVTASPSVP